MSDIDAEIMGLWEGCICENCMFLRRIQRKYRISLYKWIEINFNKILEV